MNESFPSHRTKRSINPFIFGVVFILAFGTIFSVANSSLSSPISIVVVSFNSWCDYGWPSSWLTIQRGHDQHIVAVTITSWFGCLKSVIACGVIATALVAVLSLVFRRFLFQTANSNDRKA
jgi:hypothetical protein